jgi:hypothetical protein
MGIHSVIVKTGTAKGADMERDENTFAALKEMAEDIHLGSRNDNDELISIEYYVNLQVLTQQELVELERLWHHKCITCQKEKLASQWMVIQVFMLIGVAIYIAWISGGIAGAVFSIMGVVAMIAMIEDKRVRIARRNLADARQIYQHLCQYMQSRSTTVESPVEHYSYNKTTKRI